jgi:hypothetical protein
MAVKPTSTAAASRGEPAEDHRVNAIVSQRVCPTSGAGRGWGGAPHRGASPGSTRRARPIRAFREHSSPLENGPGKT